MLICFVGLCFVRISVVELFDVIGSYVITLVAMV